MAKDIGLDLASLPYRWGASAPQRWIRHFHVNTLTSAHSNHGGRHSAQRSTSHIDVVLRQQRTVRRGTFWQPCHLPA